MAIVLTDENFEKEIAGAAKPVLVDFFAVWCEPCAMIAPVLEKIAKDFEGRLVLAKTNIDEAPLAAQKFGVNQIPTVILFANGRPVSGFHGARPEEIIKEWLANVLKEIAELPPRTATGAEETEEKTRSLINDYSAYARQNGFNLNPEEASVRRVIAGLFANEKKYGEKYCPCRRVTGDKTDDVKNICPCAYHKEEIARDGHCLCRLFVK